MVRQKVMNKDLYNILGVDRGASDNEIKKAYKRLALRYHPDRQAGKTNTEKKEAEDKFKEISWAYSILSDPEKKQRYDQFGMTDDQQMGGEGFDPTEMFSHFANMFGGGGGFDNFFNMGGGRSRTPQVEPGQSIRMAIPVSIEELLNGIDRDVEYDIEARCESCGGAGGEGAATCPHCHGTGMITETRRTGFGIMQNSRPCPYCGGSGQTISKKCTSCEGTGKKRKTVKVRVNIAPGVRDGYEQLYIAKGYESKSKSAPNGDLLLQFRYTFDTSKYRVNGQAIYEQIEVPYYDCILGKNSEQTLPNGTKVNISIKEYSDNGTMIYSGKQFGSLKYYYVIKVKMPKYIDKDERQLLSELQNKKSNA